MTTDTGSAAPKADELTEVARAQTDELYDVIALLSSAAVHIDAAQSHCDGDPMHNTLRLVYMARDKVGASIAAFDKLI